MVREAQANAEADRKAKEQVEVRNRADNAIYTTERMLKDLGDKVSESEKSTVEAHIADLKKAIEAVSKIKREQENLRARTDNPKGDKDRLGKDQFEIIQPSISILAEPTVALVDGNITSEAQKEAAQAYLEYLYSPEGQAIALKHYYRAWDTSAADPADVSRFTKLEFATIDDFGGWQKVQPEHFGDGGIFDQIYTPR